MSDSLLNLSNFLVIGSYSRNAGKTSFSTKVIEQYPGEIQAVKVTIVAEDHSCPHGDEGCGVCSSLCSPYEITEETDRAGKKDTAQLLAAGAAKVYWLRVKSKAVLSGLKALKGVLDPAFPVLCESNSIIRYINPGVYLQLKARGRKEHKKSAISLIDRADLIIETTPEGADFDFSRLRYTPEGWTLRASPL
jgi:hypothetical protein